MLNKYLRQGINTGILAFVGIAGIPSSGLAMAGVEEEAQANVAAAASSAAASSAAATSSAAASSAAASSSSAPVANGIPTHLPVVNLLPATWNPYLNKMANPYVFHDESLNYRLWELRANLEEKARERVVIEARLAGYFESEVRMERLKLRDPRLGYAERDVSQMVREKVADRLLSALGNKLAIEASWARDKARHDAVMSRQVPEEMAYEVERTMWEAVELPFELAQIDKYHQLLAMSK